MSRNSAQRGHTLPELLSTIFVLALMMSAIAFFFAPLLKSQNQTQAKVDTVEAAAMALYRVERDIRTTTIGSIYACTTGATPACTTPGTTLAPTSAIVVATAYSGGTGQFQLVPATGQPNWQGATVYWIDSSGDLEVAFDRPSSFTVGNALSATDAQNAVSDATASGGMHLARFVNQMSLAVPASSGHKVSLSLQAQSTIGSAFNETTYQTDLETRN